jgi:hypothetical protein
MPNIYRHAMDAQSACNLSGVVKQFARDLDDIWAEVRAAGGGTDQVNRHPVSRLYAEQIAFLSGSGMGDSETYHAAYTAVCEKLGEDKHEEIC